MLRKGAMIARPDDMLANLPGEGESLHAVVSGRGVDASRLLTALVGHFGAEGATLHISTLCVSRRNFFKELVPWADAGARVTLLVSTYFTRFNRAFWRDEALPAAASRPGLTLAHALTHCKVAALQFTDGSRWAMEGSANLKSSGGGNWEQFSLTRDAALHAFHVGWITERVKGATQEAPEAG